SLWRSSCVGAQTCKTAKDGRFTLNGFGRGRDVLLRVEGPRIEQKNVWASTKPDGKARRGTGVPVEVIVGPTKPIAGTIRGADHGKPLAGVAVYGAAISNPRFIERGNVHAVSDKQGRYRLLGLPKAGKYRITFYPARDQNYLVTERVVGDTE